VRLNAYKGDLRYLKKGAGSKLGGTSDTLKVTCRSKYGPKCI
jgi:hypothetical protein